MHTLTKSKGNTLSCLKCLPIGILESKRMVLFLGRWAQRGGKAGEFMVEQEDKNDISTDDKEK